MTPLRPPTFLQQRRIKVLGAAGGVLLVVIATATLIPQSRSQIATVDNQFHWQQDAAPSRREVVWQPAVAVTLQGEQLPSSSYIRPQITDYGNSLYFTVRTAEDDFDIVRSRRMGDGWSVPQSVNSLNSAARDVGPVISANGKVLYLYSNRDGGFGGMDLYASVLADGEWSKPVNLGPKINSPAHELDPAISPDSQRLYFSSNRSERMHRQWIDDTFEATNKHWGTTLRGDPGNQTFDLFAANWDGSSSQWQQVISLSALNTPDHNEGAPFVSPEGAFLLFASDRPTGRIEAENFDIYRAPIIRPELPAENLGVGVNTPANEIEPCLTAAGFQLLFSRSDSHDPSRYGLYQCTAQEVYHNRQQERSNWQAFSSVVAGGVKRFIDHFWQLLFLVAAIALLVWLIRQIKSHRVAISGFLCAALLIHLCLVTGSFFVFFQRDIASRLRRILKKEPVVATQVLLDSTAPTAASQPSFDSVAQLEIPDSITRADYSKQDSELPQSQPIEFARPQRVVSNAPLATDVPRNPLVATVLIADQAKEVQEPLPRAPVPRNRPAEQLVPLPIVAVEISPIEPVQPGQNEMARQELPEWVDPIEPISPEAIDQQPTPEPLSQAELRPTELLTIKSPSTERSLDRRAIEPPKNRSDADSLVATETIVLAADAQSPTAPDLHPKVDVARREPHQDVIHVAALAVSVVAAPAPAARQASPPSVAMAMKRDSIDREDPLSGGLSRRTSNPSRDYADEKLNLQSLLLRRKLDEATKVEVIKQFGGNDQTLATIRRGLTWIEQHQASDGHWGLHDFDEHCQDHKKCEGRGNSRSDTAGTGLALLPFLGDGNTHQSGPYKDVVAGGITWLLKNQKPDGNLFTGGEGNSFMYSHGIATIALCECYSMTNDESLRGPAQRAIDFIVAAQDPNSGGWRYQPRQQADTSVVGWQVMALKSAQMADLNVPEKSLKESERWLASVAGDNHQLGQFAYQAGRFNPAMTAEAILCLQYLGQGRDSEQVAHGVEFMTKNLPKQGRETSYYWYYGTQAMFHHQGDHWQQWNNAIHPLLIESQTQEGPMAGTWDPRDQWEKSGGRIYATSLRVLMLEVYYRHLPIYQVIQ